MCNFNITYISAYYYHQLPKLLLNQCYEKALLPINLQISTIMNIIENIRNERKKIK